MIKLLLLLYFTIHLKEYNDMGHSDLKKHKKSTKKAIESSYMMALFYEEKYKIRIIILFFFFFFSDSSQIIVIWPTFMIHLLCFIWSIQCCLLALNGSEQLKHSAKYLLLCSMNLKSGHPGFKLH